MSLIAPLLALLSLAAAPSAPCADERWVGAWASPPSGASGGAGATRDETARVIVTPTVGGSRVRVRLSNRFGTRPVTFASATIARRAEGSALVARTITPLTFGGERSVTAAAGTDVVSDPAPLEFDAFQPLAVSVHVREDVGAATEHRLGRQISYLTPDGAGDHTGDADGSAFAERTTTRPFVAGLDVRSPAGAVVALGDSITDGSGAGPGGAWPEILARRLHARGRLLSVLNAGISGNRVLRDRGPIFGRSALHRLRPDVLQQAGVTTVILLEGINDLGQPPHASVPELLRGYRRLIARLHRANLRVLHGTLTPSAGYPTRAYATRKRERINAWIRAKSPADGVVDFDKAVRDQGAPRRLRRAYDSGDHLHLNRRGYRAMARAIRIADLRPSRC